MFLVLRLFCLSDRKLPLFWEYRRTKSGKMTRRGYPLSWWGYLFVSKEHPRPPFPPSRQKPFDLTSWTGVQWWSLRYHGRVQITRRCDENRPSLKRSVTSSWTPRSLFPARILVYLVPPSSLLVIDYSIPTLVSLKRYLTWLLKGFMNLSRILYTRWSGYTVIF